MSPRHQVIARRSRPAFPDPPLPPWARARLTGPAGDGIPGPRLSETLPLLRLSRPPAPYGATTLAQLAGIAAYSLVWPAAGLTCSLYLKELYVVTAHRGRGIGTLLMRSLIDVASDHGCSRVEWTADTGNPSAQAFYRKLGIPPVPSKVFYRIEGNGGLPLPG